MPCSAVSPPGLREFVSRNPNQINNITTYTAELLNPVRDRVWGGENPHHNLHPQPTCPLSLSKTRFRDEVSKNFPLFPEDLPFIFLAVPSWKEIRWYVSTMLLNNIVSNENDPYLLTFI